MDLEHPNLNLSSEEKRLFGQLFSAADTDNLGVVTGEVAVKFFEKTKLQPAVLGEVSAQQHRVNQYGTILIDKFLDRSGKLPTQKTEDFSHQLGLG